MVAPPATGTVAEGVAASVEAWLNGPPRSERIKAVILSPHDASGAIEAWALGEGHTIHDSSRCTDDAPAALAVLDDVPPERMVVVPRLERWRLRCHGALAPVRVRMSVLGARRHKAVLGCNTSG